MCPNLQEKTVSGTITMIIGESGLFETVAYRHNVINYELDKYHMKRALDIK
jgi:hypothetical protein